MQMYAKMFLLASLVTPVANAELMYFDVAQGQMDKQNPSSKILRGQVEARDVQVVFSTEKFEIDNPTQTSIDAEVEWDDENSIFAIKKDNLKFSTALAKGLGISGLENVELKEAQVKLDKKEISMKGDYLGFAHSSFRAALSKAKIVCPTGGVFNSEIDKVCLNISQSEIGKIEYQQNVFDADFIKAKADITESKFGLKAEGAVFNDKAGNTIVDSFKLECSKVSPSALKVDTFSILQGCLKKTDVRISSMNVSADDQALLKEALLLSDKFTEKDFVENKDLIDLDHLKEISLVINNGRLYFKAKLKALFWVKVRLDAVANLYPEKRELTFKINDVRVLGVPFRKLAYRLIKKFGRVDYIELRGDLVVFKL